MFPQSWQTRIIGALICINQLLLKPQIIREVMGAAIVPVCCAPLIRIKDISGPPLQADSDQGRAAMPVDAIILCAIILAFFVAFGAVLMWADFYTRPHRLNGGAMKIRRRPF